MNKIITVMLLGTMALSCNLLSSLSGSEEEDNTNTLVALLLLLSGTDSTDNCYQSNTTAQSTATTTASSGNYVIVDTNQTACYNQSSGAAEACSGTGYDADYSGSTSVKTPSYTAGADGSYIIDNRTGLMWTQSTDTNGDSTINSLDKLTQANAYNYCQNLTTGGFNDWRLPDIKTLYSLMYFSGTDASTATGCSTSGDTSCDTSSFVHFIDTAYFDKAPGDVARGERGIDGQYATTSNYVHYTELGEGSNQTMFGVNFVDGRIKGYPCSKATDNYYVRCVRGNTSYGLNNFTDNGNGTITDSATGLVWSTADYPSTDFDNAVSVCESLSLAGQSDWRLPNAKELHSIMDYSRSPDTTSSGAIHSLFTTTSIANEAGTTDYAYYWTSSTHLTSNGDGRAGVYLSFGRALGFIHALYDVHGAGAQRSNRKTNVSSTPGASNADLGSGIFYYQGPQGDVLRNANRVRCVRN